MAREEFTERIRQGLASLRRPTAQAPPRLSRWGWTADVTLAVFLAAATVYSAARSVDTELVGHHVIAGVPPPPPAPAPPGLPWYDGPPRPGVTFEVTSGWASPGLLALAALTALPLVLRRRFPLCAYWAVLTATLAFHFVSQHARPHIPSPDDTTVYTFAACVIAAYSAAVLTPFRGLGTVSLFSGALLIGIFHDLNIPDIAPGFVPFLVLVPVGLVANTIHTWRQRIRGMEAEQRAATRLAVDKERARIARELHDVVTHNVSMMTVQAGAARTVMVSAPEQAQQALLAVEAAGRQAMNELRHVMGLLAMTTAAGDALGASGEPSHGPSLGAPRSGRADGMDPADSDGPADLAPQPGLGQVAELADRVRGTGMPVELILSGSPVSLPAGVDLAAYRVVQEALTNTVKHATGASVKITVDYLPDEVRIEVADTGGTPSTSATAGNGRGLIGLRERLAVYGGTLDAGRRVTGGFRVRAVLPMGDM